MKKHANIFILSEMLLKQKGNMIGTFLHFSYGLPVQLTFMVITCVRRIKMKLQLELPPWRLDVFLDLFGLSARYNKSQFVQLPLLLSFAAPEQCQAPLDLIFLLDASGSVGADNYAKEKEFIKIVASRYDLETASRAAVIVFSTQASNEVLLGMKNTSLTFATAVDDISYVRGYTRIDLALRLAYDDYFLSDNENATQKLVILLTDGIQTRGNSLNPPYLPIENTVALLHSKSARIFAVAIGQNIDMTDLRTITEREEDIFRMTEFNDLVAKADTISKTSCVAARKSDNYFLFLDSKYLIV